VPSLLDHSMDAWTCPSCGATATTPYCGRCGERRLDVADTSIRSRIGIGRTRSFVGRTLASLRALFSPPGRLTRDWIRGRRVGYLTPISLFLWVNVAFFLIQSASGLGILTWPLRIHLSDDSISWLTTWLLAHRKPGVTAADSGYAAIFDALEAVHAKSLVIVMVPAFAVVVGALTLDRREPFRHVFTFATHFFAFALLWLSLLFPLAALVLRSLAAAHFAVEHHAMDMVFTAIEGAGLAAYLYVALGTVFAMSRLRRAVTVVGLILALYAILKAYHVVVFAVTLYST
jgi:hypothetical protein